MGCWNATCNVSNLPIFAGEKVVVIPLVRVMEGARATNCCYPTDNFVPYAFPIFGEYNDYGGVENATTLEDNKNHLMALEFFSSRRGYDYEADEAPYEPCKEYESFDDFVSNVICSHEGCYIKESVKSELHPNGMSEISFMMIHHDLYMAMIEEISNRVPYGHTDSYSELLLRKFKKYMTKHRENFVLYSELEKAELPEEKHAKSIELLKAFETNSIMHEIFDRGTMLNTEKWKYFANLMMDDITKEDEILENVVKQNMLTMALSAMRKGYLCDSGCGSQSQETKIHVLLANFIINHVKKLAEEDAENSVDSQMSPDGEEETFFFSMN